MPRPRLLLFLIASFLPFGGAACSDDALEFEPVGCLDLLVRRPDVLRDEPGRLDASAFDAWSRLRLSGWDKTPAPAAAEPCAVTNQPVARLELPVLEATARELRVRAWRPSGAGPPVAVRLNGVDVGELALTPAPRDFTVATPAEAWRAGANLLELAAEGTADASWTPIAVAWIEYGAERHVRAEPGEPIRLAPRTGAVYRLELPSHGVLRIGATAGAGGTLEVALGALDPADGRVSLDGFARLRPRFSGARVETVDLPLPRSRTGLLQLELTWQGDTPLEITQLAVSESEPRPRPPVVFISVDTMAARHLSVYGYGRATTPNLERFAEDAVVFEHCVANAPWTMPSYLSVMTGLYPRAHHVALQSSAEVVLGDDDYWQIAPNRWTLAEALRGRAYRTRALVDSMWLSPTFNLDQGFDSYDMRAAKLDFEDPSGGIVAISGELARVLGEDDGSAPLFYFVHVLDAHGPYWPEAPFRDRFAGDRGDAADWRVVPARGGYRTNGAIPYWMALTVVPGLAQGDQIADRLPVEPLIARYDEALLKTDAYLGRIFDTLRERGLYDRALVIVSADHGESFEHDHFDHGELWEDVLHVPLLVKLPGERLAGRRVATTVQLVDLLPTVLDLLGLDPARPYLHGRSLVPLMEGADTPRATFSEGGFVRQAMLLDGGWKLIEVQPALDSGPGTLLTHRRVPPGWLEENFPELVGRALSDELLSQAAAQPDFADKLADLRTRLQGPYYELYELATDPDELHDRSASEPERVERMKALLRRERAREASARSLAERTFEIELGDEARKQLEAIGYFGEEEE